MWRAAAAAFILLVPAFAALRAMTNAHEISGFADFPNRDGAPTPIALEAGATSEAGGWDTVSRDVRIPIVVPGIDGSDGDMPQPL